MGILIRGGKVLTLDEARPVVDDGAVLIEGDCIVAVDRYEELARVEGIEREIGHDHSWVTPAFVNAHYHNWRTYSMGATVDAPLEIFLLRMSGFVIPPHLEAEFGYWNALVSAIQLVRSGVGLTLDMALSNTHREAIKAYLDLGLDLAYAPTARSQLGYVYADDESFLASLPKALRSRVEGAGLGLTGAYIDANGYERTWRELKTEFGRGVQFVVAPDGPEWCSEQELRRWDRLAREEGACLHLHNSESPMEMQWALQTRSQTMTEYLASLDILGPHVSCGHGVWYSEKDVELLATAGATSVHCPSSNLRLSNGIAPVADYQRSGLNVALGTDGQGFSDDSSYLDELRLAHLLQRTPGLETRSPKPSTMFEIATVNGARGLQRENLGRLQVGAVASMVVLDAEQMSYPYLWPGHDPYSAMLQRAQSAHVRALVSRGKVLMDAGVLEHVDESHAHARLAEMYEEIWSAQSAERQALVRELEPHVVEFFEQWRELPVQPHYVYNRV